MYRKTRLKFFFSWCALLAIVLQACALAAPKAVTPTAVKTVKLKAVVLPYTSSGPLFIAQDEGYFTRQGLEVEFVRLDTGGGSLPLLENGEVDVAASGPTVGLLNAIGKGGRIRIVADKGNLDPSGCTFMAFLAGKNWGASHPVSDTQGVAGARVSIDPTNFEAFMLEKILAKSGLTLKDLQVQDIAPPSLAEAAKNQAVDLISIGEPWVTRLLDTGEVSIWQPDQQVAPNLQFGVILFGKNLLEGDPQVGMRFMKAYLEGVQQYNKGKTDRNVEILAKYTKLDPDLLRRACWPTMAANGAVNMDSILAFQEWAVAKGLVEKEVDAAQIWDGEYASQALK